MRASVLPGECARKAAKLIVALHDDESRPACPGEGIGQRQSRGPATENVDRHALSRARAVV